MSEVPPSVPPPIPPAGAVPPSIPPIPEERGRERFVQLARASWASVAIVFVLGAIKTSMRHAPESSVVVGAIISVVAAVIMLTGIVCGIVALFGVWRYGARRILPPALLGLALWVTLSLLALPAFLNARESAKRASAPQTPVVHLPGAQRIDVKEARISFDLPDGFQEIPQGAQGLPPNTARAFIRPGEHGDNRILIVSIHKGIVNRQLLQRERLPANATLHFDAFDWRGRQIDAFRVVEHPGGEPYLTWNLQIPLHARAVQIGFGGNVSSEVEVRATAQRVLGSLEENPRP